MRSFGRRPRRRAGAPVPDERGRARRAAARAWPAGGAQGIGPAVTHRAGAAGLLAVDLRIAGGGTRRPSAASDARARALGAVLSGLYVQTMAKGGAELLFAAFRDPLFGLDDFLSASAGP